MAKQVSSQATFMQLYVSVSQKALRASLEVSYLIGKNMKPHNTGESLVLPAAIKIASIMHREKYGADFMSIPLSSDTVSGRISIIAHNIEAILLSRLRDSPVYAIQLDETTDISKMSQLIVYVRYIYKEDICEDFLCCKRLEEKATGENIFNIIQTYFHEKKILLSRCTAICTDGAAALTGAINGFKGLVTRIAPHIVFNHCIIHRQALVMLIMNCTKF